MDVAASAVYEAVVDFGVTGLVGTLGLTVLDNEGNVSVARSTTNIIEISGGVYSRTGNIAPATTGQYSIQWDDGALTVGHVAIDELNVADASTFTPTPLPTADSATVDVCALWASSDDMADCCPDLVGTDDEQLTWALLIASDLLYNLSGQQYPGICTAIVRPCSSYRSCWAPLDEGWYARDCSCRRLSKIRLAGYPVHEITSVTIDGETVPSIEYRLDYQRELVRLADADGNWQGWPTCQRLDLASGEGTFFITYTYGLNPTVLGSAAAAQLACEIAKQCPGASGPATDDCALPAGTVRISRQGITIDSNALGMWLIGSLRTGLPLVDAFLSEKGQTARRPRTALAVPEMDPWPLRVG